MSFGFSVGDFVNVGGLCWKLYKKCKDSPGNYKQLTSEVGALHNVIKETEELLSQQNLNVRQKEKLRVATVGCGEVLQDLDHLLAKYGSMGTKSQRTFDRLGFGTENIDGIRTRLISNVTLLDAFNNASSNARLEEKLNTLITEIRSGKREGSVISIETVDSITRNDREAWDAFRKELEDVGVSSSIIVERRQFLILWLQEAVAAGRLEEDSPGHESREDNDDPWEQSTSTQGGVSRRANHECYASSSARKPISGKRQIDRSVRLAEQRTSKDTIGSDGTPIDLGGLAIAKSITDRQMEPLPLQLQPFPEDPNHNPNTSQGSHQVVSGEISNPHVHWGGKWVAEALISTYTSLLEEVTKEYF